MQQIRVRTRVASGSCCSGVLRDAALFMFQAESAVPRVHDCRIDAGDELLVPRVVEVDGFRQVRLEGDMPRVLQVVVLERGRGEHSEIQNKAPEDRVAQLCARGGGPLGLHGDVPRANVEDMMLARAGPARGHEEAQPVVVEDVDDDGRDAEARGGSGGGGEGPRGDPGGGGRTRRELELDDVSEGEERGEEVLVPPVQRVVARGEDGARARAEDLRGELGLGRGRGVLWRPCGRGLRPLWGPCGQRRGHIAWHKRRFIF